MQKCTRKLRNENENDNELEKNFENMIFKKKLVPLLLDRHFALAASFQLFGYKAWKEFREASLEINFYKKRRDKELPQQLRREQLDYKAFWSGSFKALCLSTFDGNNFKEETFEEETFTEESFADSSLEEETFSESTFEDQTFKEETFKEETFPEESFEERSFEKSSLEASSFEHSSLQASSLQQSSFEENSFDKSSLDKSSFDKHSFTESSFNKSSFEESSFDTNNLDKQNFYKSSLEESSLQPNSFEDSSSEDRSFQEDSLAKATFQRTALTPELSELERPALHTALHLEQPALKKAASSLELSASTAQLRFEEASFSTTGGSSKTSSRRGGVLSSSLPFPSFTLLSLCPHILRLKLRQLAQEKRFSCSLSNTANDFPRKSPREFPEIITSTGARLW